MNPVALFDVVVSIRTGHFRFGPGAIIWTFVHGAGAVCKDVVTEGK